MPAVLLSVAISLDGCLDDASEAPLRLSSPEDADAVDALRASVDAIMVGGATVRKDNPRLLVRSEARKVARTLAGRAGSPVRVVLTRSADLGREPRLLADGAAATWVFCRPAAAPHVPAHGAQNVEVHGIRSLGLPAVLRSLARRGCERVMIEGGERLGGDVLASGLADEVRIGVAPTLVGRRGVPRLGGALRLAEARGLALQLVRAAELGSTAVLHYARVRAEEAVSDHGDEPPCDGPESAFRPRHDAEWLAEAVELSRRCPFSAGAFSVGAVIVSPGGRVLATGYSRELDAHVHAEEAALRKAARQDLSLDGATLYSSMEPCSVRLSGREPCVAHILRSGIRRVVYALAEPPVFVQCHGHAQLEAGGVTALAVPELAPFAESVNRPTIARAGTQAV